MASNNTEGALEPPPNVTPNFTNPPHRDVTILTVGIVSIIVSTIFTALRGYVRIVLIKRHGWEDYLLFAGWLFAVVYMAMMPYGLRYRVGVHQWNVPQELYEKFLKGKNPGDVIYSLASCTLKTAIIVQLRRIFVVRKDILYWILMCVGIFNVLFYIAIIIARLLACIPREKIWKPEIPGKCTHDEAAVLTSAIVNVHLDFILLLIPVVKVWRLQMSGHNKAAVLPVFGVGIFACVSSVMRTVESAKLLKTDDLTYAIADVAFWCDAELATGIICCCLPVMPRLYNAHIGPFFSTMKSKIFSTQHADTSNRRSVRIGPSVGRTESETEIWSPQKMHNEEWAAEAGSEAGKSNNITIPDQAIRMTTTFELHDMNTPTDSSNKQP